MKDLVAILGALGLLLVYQGLVHEPRSKRNGLLVRLDGLLKEAGLARLTGTRLALACLGAGLLACFVTMLLMPSGVVVLLAFMAGGYVPVSYIRVRRHRRRRVLREAWPDALAGLVASIRAGASLAEACSSLATRGPRELRPHFAAFRDTYRSAGSLEAALSRLRDGICDPVADRVVAALTMAHQVGGSDLVRVLRTLADFVREDLRARKEVEARWSWTVTAARVAAAAPWIVLAMMSTRPEAARAYASTAGMVVVSVGAIATVVGYRLMLRAARLPEDRRLAR
jgi:tight adherence protein B